MRIRLIHAKGERRGAKVLFLLTFSGPLLVSPLYQQVARTLGKEGQDAQLQGRRQGQERKQVVPPRFLQSNHDEGIDKLGMGFQ